MGDTKPETPIEVKQLAVLIAGSFGWGWQLF